MYEVGAKVVYPVHGVGIVSDVKEQKVLNSVKTYYVVRLSVTDMTVMVPVDIAEDRGLRQVADEHQIKKVFEILQSGPDKLEDDWKIRRADNQGKIKRGGLLDVCEVVRDLYYREKLKDLSTSEKRIFETAFQLVVEEVSLSQESNKSDVERSIKDALSESLNRSLS